MELWTNKFFTADITTHCQLWALNVLFTFLSARFQTLDARVNRRNIPKKNRRSHEGNGGLLYPTSSRRHSRTHTSQKPSTNANPHPCSNRENITCKQLQAGFLTCILPQDPFPSTFVNSGTNVLRIYSRIRRSRLIQPHRTLTEARPSRILTVFPFDYPSSIPLSDLKLYMKFFKRANA